MAPDTLHPKQRADAGRAFNLNLTAVCSSNPTTNGKPEPCPAGRARASLVHPVEPLEQVRQVGIADPDAGIAHHDDHGVVSELPRYDDLPKLAYAEHLKVF
jgi:hypothetical protein